LELTAGSLTLLEGPNGAGKTTLLSIIGTALRPTSGSVLYGSLGDDRQAARGHIGWVGHESHCYRQLSARENVSLAGELHGLSGDEGWARVGERLGLGTFADIPVGALSRGQRQRVALARALVHEPSLLLLDEPWTGLDLASGDRLASVVAAEVERGAVVVVVSHELERLIALGARRIRLERGRIASG
jgi:ABC-type multidrug transport system ATPase subunit